MVRRPRAIVRLTGAGHAVRERLELHPECLNFQQLPKHHVAQFGGRAFQKSDLGLYLLQALIVHNQTE